MRQNRSSKETVRYEVDPYNRLVARSSGTQTSLRRFRRTVEGIFTLDKKNSLTYVVKTPATGDTIRQIKLEGNWSLDPEHNLVLTLDKSAHKYADRLVIKGDIIAVSGTSLGVAVRTRQDSGKTSVYLLQLGGTWQADARNRLTFLVENNRDQTDILTFEGGWEIDRHNRIIYRYEKKDGRNNVSVNTLEFRGHWDISDTKRLSYVLTQGTDAIFVFQTGLARYTSSAVEYQVNIQIRKGKRPEKRTLKLSGSWKLLKNVGLVFTLTGTSRTLSGCSFGAQARLTRQDTVLFDLTGKDGRKIGMSLELSRSLFSGEGHAFIKLLKKTGTTVSVGAGLSW